VIDFEPFFTALNNISVSGKELEIRISNFPLLLLTPISAKSSSLCPSSSTASTAVVRGLEPWAEFVVVVMLLDFLPLFVGTEIVVVVVGGNVVVVVVVVVVVGATSTPAYLVYPLSNVKM
jgi:hypothetical protein